MNEYHFKVADYNRFQWILLLFLIFVLFISGYIAFIYKNALLAFGVMISLTVLFIFLSKYILNIKTINISLSEDLIRIDDMKLRVSYKDIKWFRTDDGLFVETFVIKTDKYGIKKIFYYKINNDKSQWDEFKSHFEVEVKNCQPNLPNYYDSKIWDYIIIIILASFFIIPFLLFFLDIDKSKFNKILPSLFIFYGIGGSLISGILINRKKKAK